MMTPDKNFKLQRETKMIMAMMPNREARQIYLKSMVEAQLHEEAARRAALRSREDKSSGPNRGAVAPD